MPSFSNLKLTPLSLPAWIKPHLFENKNFTDLSAAEIQDLTRRLAVFKPEQPDISVVIPAWNEANNIYRALSSLAASTTSFKVELIVINNNSTDSLQHVLDVLGVTSYLEPTQGISFARQLGLEKARGKYHLCADADTFYPPSWIELMVRPMLQSSEIVGVYGRYAFVPPPGHGRQGLWVYELFTSILIELRKKNQEFVNVLGFNMGFIAELGRVTGGFKTEQARVFNNEQNVEESEDGRMAVRLTTRGKLKMVTDPKALVYTSPRKVLQDGSIFKAFVNRIKRYATRLNEYV